MFLQMFRRNLLALSLLLVLALGASACSVNLPDSAAGGRSDTQEQSGADTEPEEGSTEPEEGFTGGEEDSGGSTASSGDASVVITGESRASDDRRPYEVEVRASSIREVSRSAFRDLPSDTKVIEARFEITNRGPVGINSKPVIRSIEFGPVTDPVGSGAEFRVTSGSDCPPDPDIRLANGESAEACMYFGMDRSGDLTGVDVYDRRGKGNKETLAVTVR